MDVELNQKPTKSSNNFAIIIAILIGAWLIGMSILAAGWLISKELAKNSYNDEGYAVEENLGPINIEVPAGIPVLGDNNAPVTIVEFADFQCPFCGEWQKTIFQELKSKYIETGKARFVFMDYAFLGDESTRAAQAARCANDQNRFWEYHDLLYTKQSGENEGAFIDDNLKQFAKELKLNEDEFNSCFDSNKYASQLNSDIVEADEYGVISTPTIYINGNKLEGILPFSRYEELIETELAK